MIFSKKKIKPGVPKPSVNLSIDGQPLSEVEKTKFLGVIIDNKLTWEHHIKYISGKIARGIGILIKAKDILNRDTLVTLYYSFVFPYYVYCNHIWGSSCSKHLRRLFVLQKKAIRIICKSRPTKAEPKCHTEPLFK